MLVSFHLPYSQQEKSTYSYLFDFVANRNGWFLTPSWNAADLILQSTAPYLNKYKIFHDEKVYLQIPNGVLVKIKKMLACEDTTSPDEEPTVLENPLIDEICMDIHLDFCQYCRNKKIPFLYRLPWPNGKPIALSISHDIDLTRKYGVKIVFEKFMHGHFKESIRTIGKLIYKNNIYWNFNELLEVYNRKDLRSTFFFIAKPWEGLSYRYNIRHRKFRRLFSDIRQSGHEIALHSSRFAFDKPQKYKDEKDILENTLGDSAYGVRQHYLRLRFPKCWKYFENIGFLYDSSCGYNHSVGFRAGTSSPFQTFDFELLEVNKLFEIPFSVMDYPWIKIGESEQRNWEIFQHLFEKVKKYKGLLNILWHPSNLAEPIYRPYWDRMITWLNDIEFYNGTLMEILNWVKNTQALKLDYFQSNSNGVKFSLTSKSFIEFLTLGLILPKPLFSRQDGVKVRKLNETDYQLIIEKLKVGSNDFYLKYN